MPERTNAIGKSGRLGPWPAGKVVLHQIDAFCAPQLTGAHRCTMAPNGGSGVSRMRRWGPRAGAIRLRLSWQPADLRLRDIVWRREDAILALGTTAGLAQLILAKA